MKKPRRNENAAEPAPPPPAFAARFDLGPLGVVRWPLTGTDLAACSVELAGLLVEARKSGTLTLQAEGKTLGTFAYGAVVAVEMTPAAPADAAEAAAPGGTTVIVERGKPFPVPVPGVPGPRPRPTPRPDPRRDRRDWLPEKWAPVHSPGKPERP